jgi:hypothetical protein
MHKHFMCESDPAIYTLFTVVKFENYPLISVSVLIKNSLCK